MRLLAPVILALLGFARLSAVLSLSDLSKVPKVINSGGGSGGKAGEDGKDDGKQNMLRQATEAKEPVYTYPMGLGNVLLNQCTEPNYTKTSPCYNSKLADLQNSICHNLMDAANYIGVGFDGRGYYRAESRKRNLVQRVCANKATFMGFDIPDTMNIFGIFETTAETKSFQSVSQYMRYVRHKAGLSNQKYLFKSEASKYSRASSRGVNGGIGSMIGATLGGVAGAAIGGAIGGGTEGDGGTGSGSQNATDQGTSESKYTQDESSEASQGEQQHFFAMMFVNVILYEITLDEVKPTDLSLAALKDYMALPASYYSVGADVKYQNFLLRWGTHFIRSGKFGGQLKITKTLRADKSMTEDQFAIHAESEFKSMFSTLQSEYAQKQTSSMKQQIRQSRSTPPPNQFSKTTVEAQGGTPEISEALVDFYTPSFKQLYHDWLMSIKDFARLFDFQLRSIDEIFKMNMDDLFPSGSKDLGCIGGSREGVKHFVEPYTNRRYYLDTRTSYSNNKTIDEQVRVYCKYSDLEQFKTDMNRRIISLERALGVYMVEGPFPTSSFELPAGQPGCEETTLSVLHTVSQSSDKLTFAELKKKPFLIAFDMPREIPGIATQHAKYRMIYRDGLWFATDPRSTTMHLYDGCQLAESELSKPKICFKNIILTHSNENGFFHIDPKDFMISKARIPRLPRWLSGTIVARPKQLGSMREVRKNFMVSKAAVPCNVRWLNSHRLDPRRDENCIHFTAATEGDIFVVFASIPQDHHAWYYVQISPDGVSFYQGMNQQKSDIEEGMGVLGGENLFQSFFVCVLLNDSQVIMQYGKTDPDSEIGKVLSGHTFPPRSQYSRLSFYSFGSGSKSVSLRDVRLTTMISSVTCLNKSFHNLNGHCVPRCHSECTGCTHADDNRACHQCKHARIEGGSGTDRVVECLSQCPAGNFLSIKLERLCVPCPAGLFKDKDGNEQCSKCPIGTYSTGGAKNCTPCSPGKFNDNVGQSSCQMCAIGHFVATERASTCSPCPFGKFASSKESTTCTDCPHGHYADKQGMSKCMPCASGSYAASLGQSKCTSCSQGQYASKKGSTSCTPCPLGHEAGSIGSANGTRACTPCQPGTFANSTGATQCLDCTPGTYAAKTATVTCSACPAGQYAHSSGSTRCSTCSSGQFSNSGWTKCQSCSPGYYASAGGSATCLPCSAGTYAAQAGSAACSPCSSTQVAPGTGSAACTTCPTNKYRFSATECKDCPDFSYNTVQPSGCYQYREVKFTSCQQESNFTYPSVLACDLAMDGSLHQFGGNGTCCAHTLKDRPNIYWMGILGQTYAINKIVIWGRHDYNNESRDIHISVWQDNQKVRECGYIGNVEYSVMTISCNGAAGNRIKIERPSEKDYLTLCEVKVYV